ncbi:MAG TPA: M23 family metallopeptidase [Propionibacteriaceae bacterium]
MSRPLPQAALARRALPPEPSVAQRSRMQQGAAALGVTVLALGIAGSVVLTGSPERVAAAPVTQASVQPSPSVSIAPGVTAPSAFSRRDKPVSRSAGRPALGAALVEQRAGERATALGAAGEQADRRAQSKALDVRERSLATAASAAKDKGKEIKADRARAAREKKEREKKEKAEAKAEAARRQANRASLPVTSGYRIAARFGDTGSWSRYHTGIDFSAGMGTSVHAIAGGEVTHAGSGSESWAGTYVTVRHSDGKSTLYAHMSTVTVSVGEQVSGGTKVGAIGMTGRTFGPHVHVELYPAGSKVGDPYEAINPAPWMQDRGLHL